MHAQLGTTDVWWDLAHPPCHNFRKNTLREENRPALGSQEILLAACGVLQDFEIDQRRVLRSGERPAVV